MAVVFVTGGSGYVGRNLIRALVGRGDQVRALVFHAAALVEPHGTREQFYRATVVGTEHMLAAARAAGVKRLVHVGTEAVLADGKPIVRADETRPRAAKPTGAAPARSTSSPTASRPSCAASSPPC